MPTSINKHPIDEREVQTRVDVVMNSYMETCETYTVSHV